MVTVNSAPDRWTLTLIVGGQLAVAADCYRRRRVGSGFDGGLLITSRGRAGGRASLCSGSLSWRSGGGRYRWISSKMTKVRVRWAPIIAIATASVPPLWVLISRAGGEANDDLEGAVLIGLGIIWLSAVVGCFVKGRVGLGLSGLFGVPLLLVAFAFPTVEAGMNGREAPFFAWLILGACIGVLVAVIAGSLRRPKSARHPLM